MGIFGKVADIICCADWITPTVGLIADAGGMHSITATVPGYTVNDVSRELERYGIKVVAPQLFGREMLITVDDKDKAWKIIGEMGGS